jgi:hypothetical protein
MADKVTFAPVSTFTNDTTAVTQTNANYVLMQNAIDNTISRDGTTPNQMNSNIDMNNNQVINLAPPTGLSSAVRLQDLVPNLNVTVIEIIPVVDHGTVNSGTVTFNLQASTKHKVTVGGPITMAFTGWPATGNYEEIEIQIVNGSSNVTWPTVNWMVGDGTSSTTFSTMGVFLQASGTNWVIVWSTDGGVTLYGKAT